MNCHADFFIYCHVVSRKGNIGWKTACLLSYGMLYWIREEINFMVPYSIEKIKKKKSTMEAEIFHFMEKSLKTTLDVALDDIFKDWK